MTEIVNAVHAFLSGVGIPVYPEDCIPEDAVLPYMSYSPIETDWDEDAIMQVRIWDRSSNYIRVNQYCDDLSAALRENSILPASDKGFIHLYKGTPWAQAQPMQGSDTKVLLVNFGICTMIV